MRADARMKMSRINEVLEEGGGVRTLLFDLEGPTGLDPDEMFGKFFMIWLPGVGEAPLSISRLPADSRMAGPFGISVLPVGPVTRALCSLDEGALIGVRGPFGNPFTVLDDRRVLLVAGGIGVAPFGAIIGMKLAERCELTIVMGARTASGIIFEDMFRKAGVDVRTTTDDGSLGEHGFTTEYLRGMDPPLDSFDQVLTCGPEIMMKGVVDMALGSGVGVQASLERHMKCGVGVCDACAVGGLCVCSDGPVFDGELLKTLEEFGGPHRDASGAFREA